MTAHLSGIRSKLLRGILQVYGPRHFRPTICSPRFACHRIVCHVFSLGVSPQVAQLPQTSYHSLQTPYSFFGLGRTNNYIENLFVGSTKHTTQHFINMEGVIPNSKVV